MVNFEELTNGVKAMIKAHLPELLVMARARHADKLSEGGTDIQYCGKAKNWEECCTVTEFDTYTQAMLWYNIGKDTHGVALSIDPDEPTQMCI